MSATRSPKAALLLGAAWTVGARWSMKAIGFLNTVVMARLLLPADYGVVAMAMLAVGLVQALIDFNAGTALLRKAQVDRDEIDSAWSLGIVQGVLTGLLLALTSPLLAVYFKEPRVVWVLVPMAVCTALASAGNIGLTLAQKEFKFGLIFRHQVASKLIGVGATVVAGYLLRDYRALVIGIVSGHLGAVALSYAMHPYRPRWNTHRMGEIWGLTKWLMLSGVAQYCLRRGDELIASRVGSTREYGLYNVGADLGQLPTGEVGPALLRALLPVLASLKDDVARANAALIKTVAALNAITLPIGLGMAAMSSQAALLVLGPSWTEASRFVAMFALISSVQLMSNPLGTMLIMRGHTKLQSHLVWLEFALFCLFVMMLASPFGVGLGLWGLALARLSASACNLLAGGAAVWRRCGVPALGLTAALARPLVGATLMYVMVKVVMLQVNAPAAQVALGVATGAVVYLCWAFVSWLAVGRPEGFESTLIDISTSALRRRKSPAAIPPPIEAGDGA